MTDAPRRFTTRSHRVKRATWALAVTLTIAAAVSCGSYSAGGKTAGDESQTTEQPLPALSAEFISAVNSTDITIATTSAPASVAEQSAVAAALAQLPQGSSASAAGLVMLTNYQYPAGELVWAIETVPAGGHYAVSGGPVRRPGSTASAPPPPPPENFRVDFVNASTGVWQEGIQGYDASL
jgi:hypothetical protein